MMEAGPCCVCRSPIWLPDELYHSAKRSEHITFYCAFGHGQIFTKSETEEQKLRRENQRLVQRMAEKDDEITRQREIREATERQLSAQRGVVTRIKNRVGHGVCPCCSRSFENLHRHMKSKHPAYSHSDVVLEAAE